MNVIFDSSIESESSKEIISDSKEHNNTSIDFHRFSCIFHKEQIHTKFPSDRPEQPLGSDSVEDLSSGSPLQVGWSQGIGPSRESFQAGIRACRVDSRHFTEVSLELSSPLAHTHTHKVYFSCTLGSVCNSPSSCFIASDGKNLVIYQVSYFSKNLIFLLHIISKMNNCSTQNLMRRYLWPLFILSFQAVIDARALLSEIYNSVSQDGSQQHVQNLQIDDEYGIFKDNKNGLISFFFQRHCLSDSFASARDFPLGDAAIQRGLHPVNGPTWMRSRVGQNCRRCAGKIVLSFLRFILKFLSQFTLIQACYLIMYKL